MGRASRKGAAGETALRGDSAIQELRRVVALDRDWGSVLDDRAAGVPLAEMSSGEKVFLQHQLLLEARVEDPEMFEGLSPDLFSEGLGPDSGPKEIVESFLEQAWQLPQSKYNAEILADLFPDRQEIFDALSRGGSFAHHDAMQLALCLAMLSSGKDQSASEQFIEEHWPDMQEAATLGERVPGSKPLLVDPRKVWVPGKGRWAGASVDLADLPGGQRLTLLVETESRTDLRKVAIHELIHQVQELGPESSGNWTEAVTEGLALLRSRRDDVVYAYRHLVAPLYTAIEEADGDLPAVLEELNLRTEAEGRQWLREEFGQDIGGHFDAWLEDGEDSLETIEEAVAREIERHGEGGIRTHETL